MNALGFALRHPLTIMVVVTAIVLGSWFSVNRMRTDVFPNLNQPVIYVAQPYGGMDPAQMEGLITNYYEYAFLFMNGIDHVESRNVQNIALVKLYFHPGTNMAQAVAEAAIYANRAKAFFPPGTVTPFIMSLDASMVPVAYVTLSSDTTQRRRTGRPDALPHSAETGQPPGHDGPAAVRRQLALHRRQPRIPSGCSPTTCRPKRSPRPSTRATSSRRRAMPASRTRCRSSRSTRSWSIPRTSATSRSSPEVNVYLRDLGTVQDTTDIPTGWALVNGRRAVYMPILKTADASTLTVATQLKNNMDDMRERCCPRTASWNWSSINRRT